MGDNNKINFRKSWEKVFSRRKQILFFLFLFGIALQGSSQQLDSYILEAEKNNPGIQANVLRFDQAREKIEEANSLPDTEFSAGYFLSEPETRTGAQVARFSVRQMIPWFGTITARENYSEAMAEAEYVEIAVAKRKLALSVAQSYYRLYSLKAQQKVLEENITLLETFRELALNSVEVGKASAVDVLRLQIRKNDLVQEKQILEQEMEAEKAGFNNLLNRKGDQEVATIDTLFIPESKIQEVKVAEVHPELHKFEELYRSVTQAELLNRKEANPKMGFGVDYIPVAERPDMEMSDNGKDILMPMLSVSIPIFNNKFKSVTRQNELKQMEIEAQREQRLNELSSLLETAVRGRNSARISAQTFSRNLEQAKDAEEILLRSYETGTINFNDVLEVQELQLKFNRGLIDAVRNYYQQMAMINYLSN